jgi:heme oxygenase
MTASSACGPCDLAGRLKAATGGLHRSVERSRFMSRLLSGRLPRAQYVFLLHNLRALYGSLEAVLWQHAADPALAPLALHKLFRSEALARDQAALHRADDGPPELVPAMVAYVARLGELGRGAPALLSAHAYVRYLGDLSGGQALGRVVARAYGLEAGAGTCFYDFGPARTRQRLIDDFRAGLGTIGRQVSQAEAIVSEAVGAFERHADLFDELEARL